MRVCPIPPLRWAGAAYVTIVRNTPLTLVFVFSTFGLPRLDIRFSFFVFAVIALTVYTSAFVCEAVRSGINSSPPGEIEAARSIGLPFRQTLGLVVLPQAFRAVIPLLSNVFIALTKNTSIAVAFSVAEATSILRRLQNEDARATFPLLIVTAAGLPHPDPCAQLRLQPARAADARRGRDASRSTTRPGRGLGAASSSAASIGALAARRARGR